MNFCLKTGPDARKGFPVSPPDEDSGVRHRCAASARRVIPLPVTGGPALSGLIEITRLAMMPVEQKRKRTCHKNTKKNEAAETKKPPVDKVRVGLITAASGQTRPKRAPSTTSPSSAGISDGEGNWKSSHSYNADDLLSLAKAADLAHTKIIEARSGDE